MLGSTSRIMQLARFTPAQHLLLCFQHTRGHVKRIGGENATPSRTWGLDYRTGLTQEKAKRPSCSAAYRHNFPSSPSALAQALAKVNTEAFSDEDGEGNAQFAVAQEEIKLGTGQINIESSATETTREEMTAPSLPPPFEDTADCITTSQSSNIPHDFCSDCPVPATAAEHMTNTLGGFPERSDDEPTAPSGFDREIIDIEHEPSVLPTGSDTSPTNSMSTNSPSMGMLNGVQNVNVTSCNFYQAAGNQYISNVTSSPVDHDRLIDRSASRIFFVSPSRTPDNRCGTLSWG